MGPYLSGHGETHESLAAGSGGESGCGDCGCSPAFYAAARYEIVRRMGLRDTVTLTYVSLVAGFLGYAAANDKQNLLLLLPYLTFGFVNIFFHHNMAIGALGYFLKKELPCSSRSLHWDGSETLEKYQRKFVLHRSLSAAMIFLSPPAIALVLLWYWGFLNVESEYYSTIRFIAWILGLLTTLVSAYFLWEVHRFRLLAAEGELKRYFP